VRLPGWLVAVGLAALLVWTWQRAERRVGALDQQVRAREQVIAALASRAKSTDTLFVRDTVNLTRIRWRTDSILRADTVERVRVDTVRLWLALERAACDAAITSCVTLNAQKDSIIAQMDTVVRDLKKQRRGCRLLGLLPCPRVSAGLNADPSGVRPGVHLGIPLF
jgi:hypothetical protein